jgi:hypothetical protein
LTDEDAAQYDVPEVELETAGLLFDMDGNLIDSAQTFSAE